MTMIVLIVCASAGLLLAAVLFRRYRRRPADRKPVERDAPRGEPWPKDWRGIPKSEDLPTGESGNGDGKT